VVYRPPRSVIVGAWFRGSKPRDPRPPGQTIDRGVWVIRDEHGDYVRQEESA
jgi:hypothetical protein